ncbi:MAG: PEP-CTERM sorting domain-containing protein [Burkholderiaceae bacterium]|nr:PEP-CTERM sorting domain-containing protein [Burkholderiaceae bacterium]
MKTFEDLAAPGTRVPLGASGSHWLDAECALLAADVCRISAPPGRDLAPSSPVPEPAASLALAVGLVVVFLWARRA